MKAYLKGLVAGALLFILIGAGVWGTYRSELFNIEKIDVLPIHGDVNSSSFEFLKERVAQQVAGFVQRPLWQIKIEDVVARVRREKWVENVRVSRALPNRFRIWISAKSVACLIVNREGRVSPVAPDGSILPPLEGDAIPDVPFLAGKSLLENKALRVRAIEIIESLAESGVFSRREIGEMSYSEKNGFEARLVRGGLKVLFGPSSSSEQNARISQVLNYVRTKNVNARVIDSRLSKKVLVRLRNEP